MVDENDLSRMGRRRLLKTLSGLGVSTTALGFLSQDTLAKLDIDVDEEVPRLKALEHTNHESIKEGKPPKREPVYYTISREKWISVESSKDARRSIAGMMSRVSRQAKSEFSTVDGIQTSVGFSNRGSDTKNQIVVDVDKESARDSEAQPDEVKNEIEDILPSYVNGVAGRETEKEVIVENIPVQVQLVDESQDAYYDYSYDPVPAGCQFQREDGNSCTLGSPVYDNDNDEYTHVTAAHCLDGGTANESEVWQPDTSSDQIGHRNSIKWRYDSGNDNFDACVINSWGESVKYDFAGNSADDHYIGREIRGTHSKEFLEDLADADDNDTIHMRGRTTGSTSGSIYWAGGDTFKTRADRAGGDSGAPHYRESRLNTEPVAFIAGVHNSGTSSYARATYMEKVEQEFNVEV